MPRARNLSAVPNFKYKARNLSAVPHFNSKARNLSAVPHFNSNPRIYSALRPFLIRPADLFHGLAFFIFFAIYIISAEERERNCAELERN